MRTLARSDLEPTSRCAVVARGSAGHNDGLEKLDGCLAEDSTGHGASMIRGVGVCAELALAPSGLDAGIVVAHRRAVAVQAAQGEVTPWRIEG
jgi:hypothetical protein